MPARALYNKEQGHEFVKLAREAIKSKFTNRQVQVPNKIEFKQARGVFVTLTRKKDRQLRGCIGIPEARFAIGDVVVKAACSAAFEDPRFHPLSQEELEDVKIEVSVLTEPSEVKENFIKNIEIGKHGLICEYLGYSGLLLPQVAIEHNFDKLQFLECLCEKAGLPKDCWQRNKFKLLKFQAQVFCETEPN